MKENRQTTNQNLLVVADCQFDRCVIREFKKRYNLTSVKIFEKELGVYTGLRLLYRHINYFILALKGYLFWRKNRVRFVVIWQQYIGLYFSLISLFDIVRSIIKAFPSKVILFYIIPKRKYWSELFTAIYDLGAINNIVYFSHQEFEKSKSLKKMLFYYTQKPLSADIIATLEERQGDDSLYIFSGGTSNRDYAQIAHLARNCNNIRFVVACTKNDIKGLHFTNNVCVYHNRYGSDFLSLLYHSYFVIIPLGDKDVTAGQIVLLRCLEFGKPILIKGSSGEIRRWLGIDGEQGVLFYDDNEELSKLVHQLLGERSFYEENTESIKRIYSKMSSHQTWCRRFVDLYSNE